MGHSRKSIYIRSAHQRVSAPAALAMALALTAVVFFHADSMAAKTAADQKSLPVPSSAAQKLYTSAKSDLLQLRVLLKNGRTQNSIGSGFLVGTGNLVVTNYHVVSQIALEPETYIGEFVDTDSRRGAFELLAVDALHDLAVLRVSRQGTGYFNVPEKPPHLVQGQHLYSLGNPLDLGFAISEGTYNGTIQRSIYGHLMFTGPINPGMSGGPSVTVDGRLAGVNVSKRMDGELVSFLVPVRYVQELFKKAQARQKPARDFKVVVGKQLLEHQAVMVDRLLDTQAPFKDLGPYKVPAWESDQMRCWGQSDDKPDMLYSLSRINCSMESSIFVSDKLRTSRMWISHEFARSRELGPLRFASMAGNSFKNEKFGHHKDRNLTRPECTEQFVDNKGLHMRAVICVRSYRKFEGLYDFAVLTTTTGESLMNLKSRMDIKGVSYENGLKVARLFIESITRENAK